MSNDTFAPTRAEIERLQQRVNANDKARSNRHAEARRLQALLAKNPISEGTLSAQRIDAITRHRTASLPVAIIGSSSTNNVYTLPRAALHRVDTSFCNEGKTAISSPCMAAPPANQRQAANRWNASATPQPPAPPQATLAQNLKAQYLATTPSDRRAIGFIAGIFLSALVCAAAIARYTN